MGTWFSAGQAEAPAASQGAETKREAGTIAQHGGVVNTPQITGVHAKGDANVTVNVNNTYVQPPDRTEDTDAVSPTSEGRRRKIPQGNVAAEDSVPAERRLRSVRTKFVDRVSAAVLNQLLDKLLEHGIINDGEMESVRTVRADKARDVIDMVLKKGPRGSSVLITALCEVDPCLSRQLDLI